MPVNGTADDDGVRLGDSVHNGFKLIIRVLLAELVNLVVVEEQRVMVYALQEVGPHFSRIAIWVATCIDE